jgi:Nitrous oxide-stimulated promoter
MDVDTAAPAPRVRKDPAAQLAAPHIARELRTVTAMLRIHCADRHAERPRDAADGLCADCAALRDYARRRLALCTYGAAKPTCANCRIHCYGPKPREAIRQVMRYAGPRMLWRHPWLALMHLCVDGRRPAPPRPNERSEGASAR